MEADTISSLTIEHFLNQQIDKAVSDKNNQGLSILEIDERVFCKSVKTSTELRVKAINYLATQFTECEEVQKQLVLGVLVNDLISHSKDMHELKIENFRVSLIYLIDMSKFI